MQNHLRSIVFLCALTLTAIPAKTKTADALSIKAQCKDNPSCVFTGADLQVEIYLTNTSNSVVGYPLEYVRRRGPTIRLVDRETGAERQLKTGLADRSLMREFTAIKPGESITFSTVIKAVEIATFRREYIDVTAEIGGSATIHLNASDEAPFKGTTSLRIVGKDTHGREQQGR